MFGWADVVNRSRRGTLTTPAIACEICRASQHHDEMLERRKSLLSAVDQLSERVKRNDQLETYDEFSRKAAEMVLSPQAQAAFAIDRESTETRDTYGRHEFGQSVLLARRLVENGVRFVTVNYGGWDHHGEIFKGLDSKLPEFDQGFQRLDERFGSARAAQTTHWC